jgi:hypothetical protein
VLSIAGLWDQWKDAETGEAISSATLIVTTANDFTRQIHDRMPVLWSVSVLSFRFLLVFLRRTPGPPPFSAMNSTPGLFEGMDDFPHIRSRGCRLRVIKDLVPDLTHLYAQYTLIEPWLHRAKMPTSSTAMTAKAPPRAFSASAARRDVRVIGGTAIDCSGLLCSCKPTAGSPTAGDEVTGERLDNLEDPFRLYRCHTILNCTRTCPKGLNPGKATASIKQMIAQRTSRVRWLTMIDPSHPTFRFMVFSETLPSHDLFRKAADRAAKEQVVPGDATGISYEDKNGRWHDKAALGGDRPETDVEG